MDFTEELMPEKNGNSEKSRPQHAATGSAQSLEVQCLANVSVEMSHADSPVSTGPSIPACANFYRIANADSEVESVMEHLDSSLERKTLTKSSTCEFDARKEVSSTTKSPNIRKDGSARALRTSGKKGPSERGLKQWQDTKSKHKEDSPEQNVVPAVQNAPDGANCFELGWQSTKMRVKERLLHMCMNPYIADICFLFPPTAEKDGSSQEVRLHAHKFVLAIGSHVFDAMFRFDKETIAGSVQEITLVDVEPSAMRALLTFLYTDEVSITANAVMSILYTAKKYGVLALEKLCVDYLKENLDCTNAFLLLAQSRLFDESKLQDFCLSVIDRETGEALKSESFLDIDHTTLCHVLARDSLKINELALFKAVVKWADRACHRQGLQPTPENQKTVLGDALKLLRFPQMGLEEFAEHVALSGLLSEGELVALFLHFVIKPQSEELGRRLPKIPFSLAPRRFIGRELTVNRFQRIESSWGYSGTADRIKFTVDAPIYLLGFGLYGSMHGTSTYLATIELVSFGTGETLALCDTSFTSDGSPNTNRVLFTEPVELQAGSTYIASAKLKGPESYYGSKGLRRIVRQCAEYPAGMDGFSKTTVSIDPNNQPGNVSSENSISCITFQFSYAAGNNNGTSVDDGQIPELIFCENKHRYTS